MIKRHYNNFSTQSLVYPIFADIFMLLFMITVMMIGKHTLTESEPLSKTTAVAQLETVQAGGDAASLYIAESGDLFVDSASEAQALNNTQLESLFSTPNQDEVVLVASSTISAGVLMAAQARLITVGATRVLIRFKENQL